MSFERSPDGGLVVERGGFGGRPAWVRCEPGFVLASTDMAWLLEASAALGLGTSLDPDRVAAEALLDAGPIGRTHTLFREIQEIPPATRAHLSPGRMRIERLEPPRVDAGHGDEGALGPAEVVERLRAHLFLAMDRAVDHAANVGVLTGGGLDSGALLAMAHARAPSTKAFAISYAGAGDDRPHLATLARSLGVEPVRVSPSDAELPSALTAAGMPLTWPSGAVEAVLLRRAHESGASFVLAGLGADEWFDGDPEANATWPSLRRHVPWMLRGLARRRSRPRFPPWAGPRARRVLTEAHERALAERPRVERSIEERLRAGFVDPHLARASALRVQLESLSGALRVDPYLDADLAAFALSLPPRLLLGTGAHRERRGLFREALAGVIPESLRTRPDKASFAPVHRALFRPPLRATLEAHASVPRLADLGIVEPTAFRRAFEETVTAARTDDAWAGGPVDARIYATLAVEAFLSAR